MTKIRRDIMKTKKIQKTFLHIVIRWQEAAAS